MSVPICPPGRPGAAVVSSKTTPVERGRVQVIRGLTTKKEWLA